MAEKSRVQIYWRDEQTGQTEYITFDAVLSETHEDVVQVTDHPVELGVNVTDHARPDPERISIEGIVSTMPNAVLDTDAVFESRTLSVTTMRAATQRAIYLDVPTAPIRPDPSSLLNAGVTALTNALAGRLANRATVYDHASAGLPGPAGNPSGQQGETRSASVTTFTQRTPRNRVRAVYDLLLKAKDQSLLCTVQTRHREFSDMLIERIAQIRTVDNGASAVFEVDLRRIRVASSQTVEAPRPAEARAKKSENKGSQATKDDKNGGMKSIAAQGWDYWSQKSVE